MASSSSSLAAVSLVFFIFSAILLISFSSATPENGGFSVDLIHRDSPRSPFYDPSSTLSDRLRAAFRRSSSRVEYIKKSIAAASKGRPFQSTVIPNAYEYLMTLSIGTKPFKILAIPDTGSDLIWTQCKPCEDCYKQTAPMFDPKRSRTYSDESCQSEFCSDVNGGQCGRRDECRYQYFYGDGSTVSGSLASDTITFESTGKKTVSIPKIVFGCTHQSNGTFDGHGSGLVGLGGGPLSLISQLGSSIRGKFSYCLVPFEDTKSSSVLSFGKSVTGHNVQSTPISIDVSSNTFYYLTLKGIEVESSGVVIEARRAPRGSPENIIIDSGTTLTYLPVDMLESMEESLRSQIGLEPIEDPTGLFELCYSADSVGKHTIPDVTFQFAGASMVLKPINTFVQASKGLLCLAFLSNSNTGISILGNIAQQNFEIGYDLVGKKLSFAPADCTHS